MAGILHKTFTSEGSSDSSGVVTIGDVHGCYTPLREIVDQIGQMPYSPTVVFVGDLLDRGTEGPQVWDLVKDMVSNPAKYNAKRVVVLKGNHEQLLVDAYHGKNARSYDLWEMNGGLVSDLEHIIETSGSKEIAWLNSLSPYYIHNSKVSFGRSPEKLEKLNLLVTHASVMPKSKGGHVSRQDPSYLYWERKIAGYDNDWITVHGHTIQMKGLTLHSTPTGKVLMIDTGSFYTGRVSGVEFVDCVEFKA